MNNAKAIVFDAYGTLFDVNSAAEKRKDKIGNKWENFANFWRTTQLEYTWLRSLMKKHKNFWQITEDSLDKSMETFQIDKSLRNDLLSLYKELSPYPEVKNVLENLKKKYYAKNIIDYDFYEELDEPNFIGFPIMQNIGGYSLDDVILSLETGEEDYTYRVSSSDSHPNTKGHKIFADHLYDRYKKIYGK